jgi:hypothetical protein
MADEVDVKIEWVRTLGIIGVALVGALGGWVVKSASSAETPITLAKSSSVALPFDKLQSTLTYFIPPSTWTKDQCVDDIAARLSLAKWVYDSKGGTQGRTIRLHWDGVSAFIYCIPKRDGTDNMDVVVAGATHIPDSRTNDQGPPKWQEFIHLIEGALVQR